MPAGYDLSSYKEIAAYLGLSLKTVKIYRKQHGLPVKQIVKGGAIIASSKELDKWLENKTTILTGGKKA